MRSREPSAYGPPFWFAYAANTSVMAAVSLLFRYADFVTCLGGSEMLLGWIVGVGMVGSLLMRLFQGIGIDRYGARRVWLISAAAMFATCWGHLLIQRADGPGIFLMRILYNTSLAGLFGASITYVSSRAPAARMAEVIGVLGTSGFVGMVIGPRLGDWLLRGSTLERQQVDQMFLAAGALCALAWFFAAAATRGSRPRRTHRQPPVLWLLRRYHPGTLLAVGAAMGFGLSLPGIFLRPFAASLGIDEIALFFTVYAPTAFLMRMATRRLPERIGTRPMIYCGLSCLIATMLLFLVVHTEWQLVFPALAIGTAHALLFPSVVAGGSRMFPDRYRGLATTLMLAMFDLGNLVGAPTVGLVLGYAERFGLPRYPAMFVIVALVFASVLAVYTFSASDEPRGGRYLARRRVDRLANPALTSSEANVTAS